MSLSMYVSSHLKMINNFCNFVGAERFCKNFFPGLVFKEKKGRKKKKKKRVLKTAISLINLKIFHLIPDLEIYSGLEG